MKIKNTVIVAITTLLAIVPLSSCSNPSEISRESVFQANVKTGWQIMPSMPEPRYNLQAVPVNGEIYVSGGLSETILSTFEKFSPEKGAWETLADLPAPRYIHNSVYLNGYLYLIGGYSFNENLLKLSSGLSTRGALNSVERFNVRTGKWEKAAPLKQARFMAGAVVHNNKIYVAGGAQQGKILDSVEVYHSEKNSWEIISKMPRPVVWGKLLSDGNFMYLVGGSGENNEFLASIDRYDPVKNEWQENYFPPMQLKRFAHSAAITEKGIYVAGGSNEQGFISSVEFFNFSTAKWQALSDITPPRGGTDMVAGNKGLYLFGTDAWYTNNTLFLPF